MKEFRAMVWDLAASECGGEMIEYALLGAFAALASVTAVTNFGKKDLLKLYTTIGTNFKKGVK
jgi:Flp pilus assembly pilin Flp